MHLCSLSGEGSQRTLIRVRGRNLKQTDKPKNLVRQYIPKVKTSYNCSQNEKKKVVQVGSEFPVRKLNSVPKFVLSAWQEVGIDYCDSHLQLVLNCTEPGGEVTMMMLR